MKKHGNGARRSRGIALALCGMALGAASGCVMVEEEIETTGSEESEARSAAEQMPAGPEATVRRYVPMAFYAAPGTGTTTTSAETSWRTAFTIHNPSPGSQHIVARAYDRTGFRYQRTPLAILAGGSASFQLEDNIDPHGFEGAVILEGPETFEVTAVQLPLQSTVVNRPVVNAASTPTRSLHFPDVRKAYGNRSTRIFVQNTRAIVERLELTFHDEDGGPRAWCQSFVDPYASANYDLSAAQIDCRDGDFKPIAILPPWKGAVTVRTTAPDGRIVGSSMLVDTAGPRVSAYEGSPGGVSLFFPVASRLHSSAGHTSAITLQNLGELPASYNLEYLATSPNSGSLDVPGDIPKLGRADVPIPSLLAPGFLGSARYIATGPEPVDAAAVTMMTRADGEPNFEAVSPASASDGVGLRLSLPYVRSTQTPTDARPETYIAIQNAGSSNTTVRVRYINAYGGEEGVHVLAIQAGRKASSTPSLATPSYPGANLLELGYPTPTIPVYGGSAIVEAMPGGGPLAAIVRVAGATTGEDYNGIPIP